MAKARTIFIFYATCAILILLTTFWTISHKHQTSNFLGVFRPAILAPAYVEPTAGFPIREKVAVIVETRATRNLIPIILHFADVLGPEWPIILLTREPIVRILEVYGNGSQPFKRAVKSGQVKLIELPSDANLVGYQGISDFYASHWLWDLMESAKWMLMFQTDSIICANSGRKVEDFFEYDFVGAAHPFWKGAFNGGLALRNVSMSRAIVDKFKIADDVEIDGIRLGNGLGMFEDVWFWDKMKDMGGHFPTVEQAGEFAVDYIWAERSLGYHGIGKNELIAKADQIYDYCPEAMMASSSQEIKLNAQELERYKHVEGGFTEGGRRFDFD